MSNDNSPIDRFTGDLVRHVTSQAQELGLDISHMLGGACGLVATLTFLLDQRSGGDPAPGESALDMALYALAELHYGRFHGPEEAEARARATTTSFELHNVLAPMVVASMIKPIIRRNGKWEEVLVLLESVITGVLATAVRIGGDDKVIDAVFANVRQRMAQARLQNIEPAGNA